MLFGLAEAVDLVEEAVATWSVLEQGPNEVVLTDGPDRVVLSGTGLTVELTEGQAILSGGTLNALSLTMNGAVVAGFSGLSISAQALAVAAQSDASGADPHAVEALFLVGDWDFVGTDSANQLDTVAGTGDGVAVQPAGNDTIALGAGNDLFDAGGGDDTIDGGSGDDVLIGGDGADVAIFSASITRYGFELGADGALIVAGAGFWTDDGRDSLTEIERLEFDDGVSVAVAQTAGGIALVQTDAADAYGWQTTEYALTEDGVTLVSRLDDLGRFTVYDVNPDGSETWTMTDTAGAFWYSSVVTDFDANAVIQTHFYTYDSGLTRLDTFDDGVRTTVAYTDTAADLVVYQTRLVEVDEEGAIRSMTSLLDNGQTEVITFASGQRSTLTWVDTQDDHDWHSNALVFEASGLIAQRTLTYDDGMVQVHGFTAGVRTALTIFDPLDVVDYRNRGYSFDGSGQLTQLTTVYDTGVREVESYDGGVRSERVQTDQEDSFIWTTETISYDATGVVEELIRSYDDGRVLTIDHVDGIRSVATWVDAADAYAWATRTDTFDAAGALVSVDFTYD